MDTAVTNTTMVNITNDTTDTNVATSIWSSQEKRQLIKCVNELSLTEHSEIFKIINKNKTTYSKNNNGIFVNISLLDCVVLDEINCFIKFCLKNKTELDAYEVKMQECKININNENNEDGDQIKLAIADTDILQSADSLSPEQIILDLKAEKDKIREENIRQYDALLKDHIENINKKKNNNLKYLNAKKKYSRKINIERKGDSLDYVNDLNYENYIKK